VIIIIKLGLASAAFTFLILNFFNFKNQIYSVFQGIIYGLSGYCIGYGANLMWLDGVILLPLIIYALIKGLVKRHSTLYIVLLAYVIIIISYICYMICMLMLIAFCSYPINYFKDKKIFIQ